MCIVCISDRSCFHICIPNHLVIILKSISHFAKDDCDSKPCMTDGDCTYNAETFQCECDGAKRFNNILECLGELAWPF